MILSVYGDFDFFGLIMHIWALKTHLICWNASYFFKLELFNVSIY